VLLGITIGGFWSIGASLAERLVPAASVPRATAVIFSSVPLGSVLGVPLGTLIGNVAGWRTAFAVLAVLSAVTTAATLAALPSLPAAGRTRLRVLRSLLRGAGTRFALLLTVLVVVAHFGTYTYVTPFLENVTRVSPSMVTAFLLAYGVAGIAGNFVGGALVHGRPRLAFALAAGLLACATMLLPVFGRWPAGAVVLLLVWGVAYGAVPVCSQRWFAASAADHPEAVSVVFTASFQATISVGALLGGAVLDATSPSTLMVVGALPALLMVAVVGARRTRSRT
jgi:predicted MFS family arabinose efflux permease